MMTRLAICIASFNRRETTLCCLRSIFNGESNTNEIDVYLADDASTDGTAEAVQAEFTQVTVIKTGGSAYWAGGMRVAYNAALASDYDYFIWLNDDVELLPHAIERAISTHKRLQFSIGGDHLIAGAMKEPRTGLTSYSGFVRASRYFPWVFRQMDPDENKEKECYTINGNFILISSALARKIGPINGAYVQTLADLDLGFKVKRVGGRNWVMSGFAGYCAQNVGGRKNYKAPGLSLRERFQYMEDPLGYPLRASIAYSKNFGLWAPVVVALPYIKLAWICVKDMVRR